MTSPKFRLFFRLFSPFSVKNQEKASLIHKKQTSTAKKEGKTPQKNRKFSHRRKKKRGKKKRVRAQKTGNARPKKKKNDQKGEKNAERKHKKCNHPLKKSKNLSKLPRFPQILTDFSVFFRAFAVFSLLLRLVLPYFCAVFALSTAVFSSFLLYFAIPFRFFHCFFTVFGSFSLFSYTFHLLRHLPPLVLDFSVFGFLFSVFFRLLRYSSAVFALRSPVSTSKIHFFIRFFAFFFCFFACTIVFRTVFFAFSCFFLRLSAFAEEKSKIRRFHLSNSKKSCEQRKRRRRKAKTGSAGRENAVKKGKSALRAGTISQKISVFLPKNLTKERLSSNSRECFM